MEEGRGGLNAVYKNVEGLKSVIFLRRSRVGLNIYEEDPRYWKRKKKHG